MGRRMFDSDDDKQGDPSAQNTAEGAKASPPSQDAKDAQDATRPADNAASDDEASEDAEPDHAAYHEHGQPHIGIDLFVAAHPASADQLAGFRHYAARHHPGKFTMADWNKHLLAFNKREIR